MRFLGTFDLRLDEKGRFILPAKWRNALPEGLVILKGQDRCLYGMAESEFDDMTSAVTSAPISDKRSRDHARTLFSTASDQTPDKQGRLTVPPDLQAYAGLTRECTLVGSGTRFEIWDSEAWRRFLPDAEQQYSALDERRSAVPS